MRRDYDLRRLEKMREGMIDSHIKLIEFLWIHPILHGWEMVPSHLFFFFRKLLEDVLTKIGNKPGKRKADFLGNRSPHRKEVKGNPRMMMQGSPQQQLCSKHEHAAQSRAIQRIPGTKYICIYIETQQFPMSLKV